jgi:protein TonB
MAEEKSTTSPFSDMLDIIFADRNKAYGAYQLRREYPKYLTRATIFGILAIAFAFLFPFIMSAVGDFVEKQKPVDVVAELGPPPDIDPSTPPPPPPPPVETPPPPTRSTVKFVPPVVKKDEEVQEEEPKKAIEELKEIEEDIGKETKKGNDEAAPAIEENPSELQVVEEPKPVVEEKTYDIFDIQKPPSFPGGEKELMKYLADNIKYPALARENNITGTAALSFVVGKDGSVSDVSILKDPGGGCGKEAVRVVQSMPKWIPGEANGNAVKVRYTLPVRFKLE